MNQTQNVSNCPKCNSTELGRGKHSGYSVMSPVNKLSLGCNIEYVICTDCGFIIEGYVVKPEKFKGTF